MVAPTAARASRRALEDWRTVLLWCLPARSSSSPLTLGSAGTHVVDTFSDGTWIQQITIGACPWGFWSTPS